MNFKKRIFTILLALLICRNANTESVKKEGSKIEDPTAQTTKEENPTIKDVTAESNEINDDPYKGMQSMTLKPSDPNTEDGASQAMPKQFQCSSCEGITDRFTTTLKKTINKYPSVRNGEKKLGEQKLIEMFEDICDDQEWVGFGVKDDEGGKTMNYPGSKRAGESGVTMWGGIWIHRMQRTCHQFLGEHDELEIYETYLANPERGVYQLFCPQYCKQKKIKKTSEKKKKKKKLAEKQEL